MNFLKLQDLSHLQQDSTKYSNNFETDCGGFARNAFSFHCFQYLMHVKTISKDKPTLTALTTENLKQIRPQDATELVSQKMAKHYLQIVAAKQQGEKIEDKDLIKLVYLTFKDEVISAVIFSSLDVIARMLFSVFILELFQAFAKGNTSSAYIFTGILAIFLYLSQAFKFYSFRMNNSLIFQLKNSLIMLLYIKTSKLTTYIIRSEDLGKIINLLSNDFSVLEQRSHYLLNTVTFPVVFIGNVVILIIRIGWPALIGTLIIILTVLLLAKSSKNTGDVVKQSNVYKDKRIEAISQTIQGIKFVKYYGWQIAFKKLIQSFRQSQIDLLRKVAYRRANQIAFGVNIGEVATFFILFLAYSLFHKLQLAQMFSALQIISVLRISTFTAVIGIGSFFEAKIVFGRFANVFNIQNKQMIKIDAATKKPMNLPYKPSFQHQKMLIQIKDSQSIVNTRMNKGEIVFQKFQGYWNQNFDSPSLKNINLSFYPGSFYGITGKVGSGKSGLLGSILGEIPYYSGRLSVTGKIAYVQQQPIIFSDTVRSNILFGQQFNQSNYDKALKLSCLISDLQLLAESDQTIIGEKGITLSGGQKVRVSLARALYSDSDIYLLDDPLSAVDSKVAKQLHQKCFKPLSKQKTVILVTHQIHFLYDCDQAIVMQNGEVVAKGPPRIPKGLKAKLDQLSQFFHNNQIETDDWRKVDKDARQQKQNRQKQVQYSSSEDQTPNQQQNAYLKGRFIQREGEINCTTYSNFFFANPTNYYLFPLAVLLFIGHEVLFIIYYTFLGQFEKVKLGISATFGQNLTLFWLVEFSITLVMIVCSSLKIFWLNTSILNSTNKIHQNMVTAIMRSPSYFFDSTPSGVLINKFSNDLGVLDNSLITPLVDSVAGGCKLIFTIVFTCILNHSLIIPTIIVYGLLFWFFSYSRSTIIAVRQLDLQCKTPIFHFFSQSFNGATQIRIYQRKHAFTKELCNILNKSMKSYFAFDLISQGLGFYITMGSLLFLVFGMVLGISSIPTEKSGSFCIIILYLIFNAQYFKWYLRQFISSQSLMVNAERINQFSKLQAEAPLRTEYDRQIGINQEMQAERNNQEHHKQWPDNQQMQITNLSARYQANLPLVLNNICLNVGKGQKIGIVGRTGAGKSSIIQALFRIFQPVDGSQYKIGGYDALKMGLHSLRQHISIIPQTSFLFKASVRQNIDPFMNFDEQQIWKVIDASGLTDHIKSLPNQLQTNVSNASECFSVGQKQLLCLARALLRKNKFLILDQATSNVDMKTDAFIQRVLEDHFKETTIITIAHRINTVANYDKIIVMQKGKIVQQGAPYQLIQRKGLFYQMVSHTGKNSQLIMQRAKESYKKRLAIA